MIFFDTETIPAFTDPDHAVVKAVADKIAAPSNWKDQDKIDAYVAQKTVEAMGKQALASPTARVVSIVAYSDEPGDSGLRQSFRFTTEDERGLLDSFQDWADGLPPQPVCGYNCAHYDLPVLLLACMRNRVKVPGFVLRNLPYMDKGSVDLFRWFGGLGMGKSLGITATALGLDVDLTSTGADTWDHFKAGELDKIEKHCFEDVQLCIQMFGLIHADTVGG